MQMDTQMRIERIEIESLDTASYLLRRFFDEEGFDAPDEEMRSALATLLTSCACYGKIWTRKESTPGSDNHEK
jgi:hypothetical protein